MNKLIKTEITAAASLADIDFEKTGGLIPALAQDAQSGMVLMLAWVNKEALLLSMKTGFAHYFSRSRQALWKKGETSGNLQKIEEILLDCDGDTLLYIVRQQGPACHTGSKSCFFRSLSKNLPEK
jgi:phosphoribosyl-AMP cyclohydrolase